MIFHLADPDYLHEGVDDFLARFRITFDRLLTTYLPKPRDSLGRITCGAKIKLLAPRRPCRFKRIGFCSAVPERLSNITIPRRHSSTFECAMLVLPWLRRTSCRRSKRSAENLQ